MLERPKGRLLGETRRNNIMEWIREEGSARVKDLAKAFNVSEVTVRQDLERLESEGQITREHGGAFLKSVPQQVRAMTLEHQENRKEKSTIGKVAATFIREGETIILDSGSTTTEVAANLFDTKNITVITNALNIALMLGAEPEITVHVSGGHFKAPTLSVSGEKSADYFDGLFAKRLFLATAAVDVEGGLSFPSLSDIAVKKAMIDAAEEVCLVADSSKVGQRSFCKLGDISLIDTFVTDSGISKAHVQAFEKAGVKVVIAE